MQVIKVYFDGGAKPNPGKAYGSYEIVSEVVKHRVERMELGDFLTNNQAEYLSLIRALNWLWKNTHDPENRLVINSDSKLLVMQTQGSWKVKCLHIRELVAEVRNVLACFKQWEIHWQPRANNVKRFGH